MHHRRGGGKAQHTCEDVNNFSHYAAKLSCSAASQNRKPSLYPVSVWLTKQLIGTWNFELEL
jgi:hypothetical protein